MSRDSDAAENRPPQSDLTQGVRSKASRAQGVSGLWAAFTTVGLIALPAVVLTAALLARGPDVQFAIDFRSVTPEITDMVHGVNPYVTQNMADGGHFLWTILAGWMLAPLALVPGGWAIMMGLELLGVVAALWLLDVSDWRMYAIALAWPATVNSFQTANVTVLVAVLVAAGWRARDRVDCGLWLGLAVAVKLFAWPVLIWLAATRRWRALALAGAIQLAGVLLTLPYISLVEFARYEQEANRIFSNEAVTPYALLHAWGVAGARPIAVMGGLCLLLWGRRDLGWCVVASLALSPILWLHYFDLLLVPLALWAAPVWVWLLPFGLWITPGSNNGGAWRTLVALAVVALTVVAARYRSVTLHPPALTPREQRLEVPSPSLPRS